MTTMYTGRILLDMYNRRKKADDTFSYRKMARELSLTIGQVANRIAYHKRTRSEMDDKPLRYDLFGDALPEPHVLEGDAIIVGDVQLPTTDLDFALLPVAIGKKHDIKDLVIAGDFVNADWASSYQKIGPLPSAAAEKAASHYLLTEWLAWFDTIWFFPGNHERRIAKLTGAALDMLDLADMLVPAASRDQFKVSEMGHMIIKTVTGDWRVTHARNYSVNQLNVADALVQKYRTHIIQHHEHHLAKGWDRYKHNIIINNGGLFDPTKMSYALLDDSKSPNMAKGFTMLKDGVAHVYGEYPYTDWETLLPADERPTLTVLPAYIEEQMEDAA